jgi:hypothetical protein
MYLLNQMHRMEGIGLTGARSAAPLVHSSYCSSFAQDYSTAGTGFFVGGMPDKQTGYICDSIQEFHLKFLFYQSDGKSGNQLANKLTSHIFRV